MQAAGACLDAWQALSPGEGAALAARQRLAQRWLAIGSEQLGRGDVAFARAALLKATELGSTPASAEHQTLQQRLQDVEGLR